MVRCPDCKKEFDEETAKKAGGNIILCPHCSSLIERNIGLYDYKEAEITRNGINNRAELLKKIADIIFVIGAIICMIFMTYAILNSVNFISLLIFESMLAFSSFVLGAILLGLSEIIYLLTEIRDGKRR